MVYQKRKVLFPVLVMIRFHNLSVKHQIAITVIAPCATKQSYFILGLSRPRLIVFEIRYAITAKQCFIFIFIFLERSLMT